MPEPSIVLPRLRLATDAELEQLEKVLETKPSDDSEERRVYVKEAYFKAAHTKGDYRKALLEVAEKATDLAEWKMPDIKDSINIEWIEEYILRTLVFVFDPSKTEISSSDAVKRQENAEAALEGQILSPVESSTADKAIDLATAAGAGALAVAFFPWVAGAAIALGVIGWLASPSMRRLLPATLILIHIRKRHEFEAVLVGESAV